MEIHETSDLLEEVPADILVLFHLADEPSPRGRLGRVDWILGSAVSRLRARGKFAGERGASALLSPNHKIKAERILVCGLGHRADLSLSALYRLSYQAAQIVLNLRCLSIVLDLPFRAFPLSPPERLRHAFLEGFQAELQRGRPEASFAITLLSPENGTPHP
ncbi:MAG TPA: M17 family peptidase N-terminal domain-containing protein [Candidatus Acidoferrum sp.]|nr:M17 family peptidase N-terminal domain-containing protein [Candidatus Acidoferrum sp.]